MVILGALIALGAALAFLLIGALTLFGGVQATLRQLIPGFRPDRPGAPERALALAGVWGPAMLVALLCLLGSIQIVRVAMAALQP